jgi:hypothetical protein
MLTLYRAALPKLPVDRSQHQRTGWRSAITPGSPKSDAPVPRHFEARSEFDGAEKSGLTRSTNGGRAQLDTQRFTKKSGSYVDLSDLDSDWLWCPDHFS